MRLAYIAPELGAVTGTFVYREIYGLRRRGFEVVPFGTMRPKDCVVSEEARALIDECTYLYDRSPAATLPRALTMAARHPRRFAKTIALAAGDCLTARTARATDRVKLLWHSLVGVAFASELAERGIDHVHAHFAHVPTSIAMYGASMAGISYSFTCHANDIFERGVALREKVARSAFAVCIAEDGRRFLERAGCAPHQLHVVRCGVDPEAYPLRKARGPNPSRYVLAVGRLVEKKGFSDLVQAARLLRDRGVTCTVRILGDGPLRSELEAAVRRDNLNATVELLGSQPHEKVRRMLEQADVFVLPCVVASTGDRDGIPVALMEAMALGVPVVSTTVSGIPELIRDGDSGFLVPPHKPDRLADSIERLLSDPELAQQFATRARETMETEFAEGVNQERLGGLFRATVQPGIVPYQPCPAR